MSRFRSAEEKILFELRKAAREAMRSGNRTDFVSFDPSVLSDAVHVSEERPILAELLNRDGDRLLFTANELYVEDQGTFVAISYNRIASFHWMKPDYDQKEARSLKREFGDQIVLKDDSGLYYELRGLGFGFQALWNFFVWLLKRRLPASAKASEA